MEKNLIVILGILVVIFIISAYGFAVWKKTSKNSDMASDNFVTGVYDENPETSTGVSVAMTDGGLEYLTTKDGMSLYVYLEDDYNVSNCFNECLEKWPIFYSDELLPEDGFGTLERNDGKKQSTYLEMPLYTFAGDKNPGDINGHGLKGVWSLAVVGK